MTIEHDEDWYPEDLIDRDEMDWPPVPTVASLAYFFGSAVQTNPKYTSPTKLRKLIDTSFYCLEAVPTDIAQNALYRLATVRKVDPKKWSGTFNDLAALLWRPPVSKYEVTRSMAEMMRQAA